LVRERGLAHRTKKGHKKGVLAGMKQTYWRIDSSNIVIIFIFIIFFSRAVTLVATIFATAFANAN
jgi:phage shock protein PspC (stress-responsive transcriptional regulator)